MFRIRVLVVMSVVCSPPDGALLSRALGHECKDKLPEAIQLVCAVGEVAVVASGDKKHPHQVERTTEDNICGADTCVKRSQTEEVQDGETDGKKPEARFG